MKAMGKWTVLVAAMVLMIGCFGGGGSSSDEDAVPATQNPILGTWQVTVDPQNQKVKIEPVTTGATTYPVGQVTDEAVTLNGTTPVNLAHPRNVKDSDRVCAGTGGGAPCYTRDVDYVITLGNPGTIARTPTGSIPDGGTVYVSYKYYKCTDCSAMDLQLTLGDANVVYSDSAGLRTTRADIWVRNDSGNHTIEEIRSITGSIAGPGAGNNPKLWNSDYPLLVGDTPNNTTNQPVEGWRSGVTYTTRGNWSNVTVVAPPAVRGAENSTAYQLHNRDGNPWMRQSLDPVCGKMSTTWIFSESQQQYRFYLQLTGDAYDWNPDWLSGVKDSRWGSQWNSTYYLAMAYLTPSGAANENWCTGLTNTPNRWYAGSLQKIHPTAGDQDRCGTLITDPHLAPGTYFALNIGLEYADWIETMGTTFWNTYAAGARQPKTQIAVGTPYVRSPSVQILWDPNVLEGFGTGDYTTDSGTYFAGGFIAAPYTGTTYFQGANPNGSAKWNITTDIGPHTGWMYVTMTPKNGSSNQFEFFGFQGTTTSTYLYVTRATGNGNRCTPLSNLPRFAGPWVYHYEDANADGNCEFVTEGADAEIDYWFGMMVMHVLPTANPGDFSYLRGGQDGGQFLAVWWNNKTASDWNAANTAYDDIGALFCWKQGSTAPETCPNAGDHNDPTWVIFRQYEMGNRSLPPGMRKSAYVWAKNCPDGKGYTCGQYQQMIGVVCVQ